MKCGSWESFVNSKIFLNVQQTKFNFKSNANKFQVFLAALAYVACILQLHCTVLNMQHAHCSMNATKPHKANEYCLNERDADWDHCYELKYLQTVHTNFLLLQKHGGLIMKSQIYYTINIPHHIKLNECIFSFHCIKMFTFFKNAVWVVDWVS